MTDGTPKKTHPNHTSSDSSEEGQTQQQQQQQHQQNETSSTLSSLVPPSLVTLYNSFCCPLLVDVDSILNLINPSDPPTSPTSPASPSSSTRSSEQCSPRDALKHPHLSADDVKELDDTPRKREPAKPSEKLTKSVGTKSEAAKSSAPPVPPGSPVRSSISPPCSGPVSASSKLPSGKRDLSVLSPKLEATREVQSSSSSSVPQKQQQFDSKIGSSRSHGDNLVLPPSVPAQPQRNLEVLRTKEKDYEPSEDIKSFIVSNNKVTLEEPSTRQPGGVDVSMNSSAAGRSDIRISTTSPQNNQLNSLLGQINKENKEIEEKDKMSKELKAKQLDQKADLVRESKADLKLKRKISDAVTEENKTEPPVIERVESDKKEAPIQDRGDKTVQGPREIKTQSKNVPSKEENPKAQEQGKKPAAPLKTIDKVDIKVEQVTPETKTLDKKQATETKNAGTNTQKGYKKEEKKADKPRQAVLAQQKDAGKAIEASKPKPAPSAPASASASTSTGAFALSPSARPSPSSAPSPTSSTSTFCASASTSAFNNGKSSKRSHASTSTSTSKPFSSAPNFKPPSSSPAHPAASMSERSSSPECIDATSAPRPRAFHVGTSYGHPAASSSSSRSSFQPQHNRFNNVYGNVYDRPYVPAYNFDVDPFYQHHEQVFPEHPRQQSDGRAGWMQQSLQDGRPDQHYSAPGPYSDMNHNRN